jgi:hypothetical protein
MKTFEELTQEQKESAIDFARDILVDGLEEGVFHLSREASGSEIDELAKIAAEESWYSDDGKALTGSTCPPFFLGGCV